MPEENKEENLPGDEAVARWQARNQNEAALMIAGRWKKSSMIPYYTRTIAIPSEGIARLQAYWQNEDASEGAEA